MCVKYDLVALSLHEIRRLEEFRGPANERKKYSLIALLNQCLCLQDIQDVECEDVEEEDVRPLTDFEM